MKRIYKNLILFLFAISIFSIFSCDNRPENAVLNLESNNKSILKYLQNDSNYTTLVRALEITNLSGMLNVYGSYTLFAPTNAAFKTYLTSKGFTDISAIDRASLLYMLKYHLYNEQYGSSFFLTGSLPTTTVSGDFIKMDISNGVKNTILNNSVKVDRLDIPVTNGVVHVIKNILEPPTLTLYNWIKSQPEYSIIVEAFEKTNNISLILDRMEYNTLKIVYGQPELKKFTVFLETNSVLGTAGITSFDDLAKKYSNTYKSTKSYANTNDSLNMFVRYHCLERKLFVSDFRDDYLETLSRGDFVILNTTSGISLNKHSEDQMVLNPVTGLYETRSITVKVEMDLDKSNQVTKNGIVHSLKSVMSVYNPKPVIVNQLFAGAPEDRTIRLLNGTTSNVQSQFNNFKANPAAQSVIWWLKWEALTGNCFYETNTAFNGNYILKIVNATTFWIEVTTKPVFKGTYDVYIVYARQNSGVMNFLFSFDNEQIGDIVNVSASKDAFGNNVVNSSNARIDRKLGTVTFAELKEHKFKLQAVTPNTNIFWYALELRPAK